MTTKLNWNNDVDVTTLSAEAQAAYAEYKAAYAVAKSRRERFERQVNEDAKAANVVTDAEEIAINYNFGKLSMAIAPRRTKSEAKAPSGVAFGQLRRV